MFALLLASICTPLLAQASTVYLHPPPPNHGVTNGASAIIAHHLRLERFEPMDDGRIASFAEHFIGEGESDGMVLSVEEPYAKDVIPEEIHSAMTLRYTSFDPSHLMSSLLSRAEHAYTHVTGMLTPDSSGYAATYPAAVDLFSGPHPSTELFLSSLAPVVAFLEEPTTGKFGVFSLQGIDAIARAYGKDSDRYKLAVETLRATLSSALTHPTLRLAVLTSPVASRTNEYVKRQEPAPTSSTIPPQLVSDAVCYGTEQACTDATSDCSGHGSCMPARKAGKECFVCSCTATKSSSGRQQLWAGNACERKDVSGSFVLLAGTTIALLVVAFGSVSLLWSMGSHELPSVLTGGAASSKRD